MLCHWRSVATGTYKRGGVGGVKHSKQIREELHCFSEGISTAMKQDFEFVKIDGCAYIKLVGVTGTAVATNYQPLVTAT